MLSRYVDLILLQRNIRLYSDWEGSPCCCRGEALALADDARGEKSERGTTAWRDKSRYARKEREGVRVYLCTRVYCFLEFPPAPTHTHTHTLSLIGLPAVLLVRMHVSSGYNDDSRFPRLSALLPLSLSGLSPRQRCKLLSSPRRARLKLLDIYFHLPSNSTLALLCPRCAIYISPSLSLFLNPLAISASGHVAQSS